MFFFFSHFFLMCSLYPNLKIKIISWWGEWFLEKINGHGRFSTPSHMDRYRISNYNIFSVTQLKFANRRPNEMSKSKRNITEMCATARYTHERINAHCALRAKFLLTKSENTIKSLMWVVESFFVTHVRPTFYYVCSSDVNKIWKYHKIVNAKLIVFWALHVALNAELIVFE